MDITKKSNVFSAGSSEVLISILDDMVRTISKSKYVNNFIIIGGFSLLSRLGNSYRRTSDIDINIDTRDSWESFVAEIEPLLTSGSESGITYTVLKRRLKDMENGSDSVTLLANGIAVKIDMNIKKTYGTLEVKSIVSLTSFNTCLLEEVLRDKLQVVFSGKLYRRIKDAVDLIYIANHSDFDYHKLLQSLVDVGFNPEEVDTSYLLDIPKVEHAFRAYKGFPDELTWENFYARTCEFTLALGLLIESKQETKTAWIGRIGAWSVWY